MGWGVLLSNKIFSLKNTTRVYRILWSFDILPALNPSSKEPEPLPSPDAFTGVLVRQPVPFKCRFKVRGSETEEVINSFAGENEELLRAWE